MKISPPSRRRGPDRRRAWQAQAPLAVTFRFHVPVGVGKKNEPRFLATPAASELVFIGHVGSSHSHGTLSGCRYQISFTTHSACEHGVMDVRSVVVRTTDAMVIHFQRVRRTVSAPKYKTKDEPCSSRSAPLVLGQLQRPVAERERVVGLQSHNVACGRGDGTAGPYISRIRTGVFHKQRRRTRMKGREAQSQLGKTGAYGETDLAVALLGFASSAEKPSRAQNGPRHPEIYVHDGRSTSPFG